MECFYDRTDPDNAHDRFQQWRRENEDGYFLNIRGMNSVMLHRTHCPHIGGTNWEKDQGFGSLTKNKKLCSPDKDELVQWANENAHSKLKECSNCAP